MSLRRVDFPFGCVCALALVAASCSAEETTSRDRFVAEVVPFFATYCVDCHSGGEAAAAGFDLEPFESYELALEQRTRLEAVLNLIRARAMPPEDALLPSDDQREAILRSLSETLTPDCGGDASPGRVTMRRLSNYEYDNTVRDLLGVEFKPSLELGFPTDDVASGFDNQGDALSVSPLLLEKYLDSAERIAEHVLSHDKRRKRFTQTDKEDDEALRGVFESLMPRAFRRPVEPIELQHVLDLCNHVRGSGASFDDALAAGLQTVLVSPHFLFRVELPAAGDSPRPQIDREPVEAYSLATRLSYFLWSSTPDTSLMESASSGRLLREDELRRQVERMLGDKKSRALVESFLHQWLALDLLYQVKPDIQRFPLWSSWLRDAMIEETERLFARVLREDRPFVELLSTEESEINPRLAELYGMKFDGEDPFEFYLRGAEGPKRERLKRSPHRVERFAGEDRWESAPMPSNRFGLLTHASVLTLTSNATDTSPVKRGKWVLESLLGDPPPPAPPTVPGLEETAADARDLPLREQLAIHRSNPNCISCHVKMDPIGLALQNYDAIGRWRDDEAGQPIDPAGELDGVAFSGPEELAELLAAREEEIIRNFVRRLLSYSLGRGLIVDDECAVDTIVERAQPDGYRLQSLVIEVVLSEPFRMRMIPREERPPPGEKKDV